MFRIITKPGCPYCVRAKELIRAEGYDYEEEVRDTPVLIEEFKGWGYRTFPQVFHDGAHVGGYTDLVDYLG